MEPSSPSDRRGGGPQIYVHVEFGMSWNKKPPKNHEITYKSRNMRERERGEREREPQRTRRAAPATTNYLAAIHTFEERRSHHRQPHRVRTEPGESQHVRRNLGYHNEHQMQEYYHIDPPPYGSDSHPEPADSRYPRGETRSGSSHERGRSAPPPLGGESSWEATATEPWATSGDQWKALPAEPSQFRLGEGGMPWSAWSWPFEYQADGTSHTHSQDNIYDDSLSSRSGLASSFPPVGTSILPRHDETGRARDLGALSAAMMTVDNGFENQWWNQGERVHVPAEDSVRVGTPDWHEGDGGERRSMAASLVSPITAAEDGSPGPHFQSLGGSMSRRRSTRSEELFWGR